MYCPVIAKNLKLSIYTIMSISSSAPHLIVAPTSLSLTLARTSEEGFKPALRIKEQRKYDIGNPKIGELTMLPYQKYRSFSHRQIAIISIIITTIFSILSQNKDCPKIWRSAPVMSQRSKQHNFVIWLPQKIYPELIYILPKMVRLYHI